MLPVLVAVESGGAAAAEAAVFATFSLEPRGTVQAKDNFRRWNKVGIVARNFFCFLVPVSRNQKEKKNNKL